ncbi:hypothetical protein SBRCBS47491_002883 [Sporothrix bragantina]|uniref:Fha domain containing protein n=1 Tax=Sporothrix bragantina TaxID=671064 RepID=A0ABP0BAV2_9PEZI
MFTQSIPAPAPAPTPSSPGIHSATPTSPASPTSRTSRLRGLSYLRNYTQSHLLNREQNTSSSSNNNNNSSSSRSGLPSPSSPSPASSSLVRTDTYPLRQTQSATAAPISTATSAAATVVSAVDPRLFLEPAVSHPLSITSTNTSQSGLSDATPSQSRSLPPGEQSASSATAATSSAAVTSLQAAYRAEQPATSDPANNGSVTAASLSTTDALAPQPPTSTAASVMTRSRSATEPGTGAVGGSSSSSLASAETLPSIRFSPFHDPRASRPSLRFAPMARTLPTGSEVIRVGRYSERDNQPNATANAPSAAHVGFKSKVVSRRHCEFWYESNQWFIRDVKSSSGTFLNHIRLSAPGTESKPYEVKDGDIVQLGIDFKGGEEMIFRCVKMRVELNRNWQNKLNPFNITSHKRLRNLTKSGDADGSKQSSQDCSICLNSIASLFVAPCSHTWHYKCIRTLLETKNYPNFICPNCRMSVDLEADVEDPPEEWENMEVEENAPAAAVDSSGVVSESSSHHVKLQAANSDPRTGNSSSSGLAAAAVPDVGDTTMQVDAVMDDIDDSEPLLQAVLAQQQRNERQELDSRLQQQLLVEQQQQEDDDPEPEPEIHVSHATSNPMPIPTGSRFPSGSGSAIVATNGTSGDASGSDSARTPPSPSERHVAPHGHEGPITPRNDAGPWVFDGSGIRIGSSRASTDSRRGEMRSLNTAAAEISRHFNQ